MKRGVLFFVAICAFFAVSFAEEGNGGASRASAMLDKSLKKDDSPQGPFHLVDESPVQAIKILEALTGRVSIQSPQLPNVKINFTSEGTLPRSEAILAFESLLSMNGIALTPLGDKFFKAAPVTGVNSQSPEFLEGRASDLPPSQAFYTKLYKLQYLDVETFQQTLAAFVSPNGISTVALFPQSNSFLLTDTLVNHQRIEMLLDNIDNVPNLAEEMGFITLKNMSAEDMKKRLLSLQGDALKKYFSKTTFEADERTNQIIVFTQKGNLRYVEDFIKKLDVDAEPITRSEVFYIKQGEAKDVESILNQIVKGQQAAVKSNQKTKAKTANTTANARAKTAVAATKKPSTLVNPGEAAGLQFSEYVTIAADERSNSIVVYGTPLDIEQIKGIIEKIDVVLFQVKIDVIITEVTLTGSQVSGLSTFGLGYSTLADSTTGKSGWSGSTSTYSVGENPAFKISADEYGFDAVFNVAKENSKVKILSAPSVVTTHNKKARINVSKRYPFVTGSTTYNTGTYPSTSSTIEWKDIGIILEVTPFIGDNGVIQMEINQEVSSVVEETVIDSNTQKIVGTREAESFISATSGDMIVLAGLQQGQTTNQEGSVYLLGDIPLIGELFKPKKESLERTELIMFIRPTIINSARAQDAVAKTNLENSPVKEDVENFIKTGRFDVKSSLDPQNGDSSVQDKEGDLKGSSGSDEGTKDIDSSGRGKTEESKVPSFPRNKRGIR